MSLFSLTLIIQDPFVKKVKVEDSYILFNEALQNVKRVKFGEYMEYPALPSIHKLMRFNVHNGTVTIMNRQITAKLIQFLEAKYKEATPAVYIHGPQGVGKSHR